ncbi:uncharacterized protein DUF4123 [Enterobacter sp. BIGb0383]|uniref:DUF4123 domain-containing protein n=1 Tax=unclassified Enterobacter TaxID=2608935 RepID=UPI000F466131|nr:MULTISPECIES: DUF4123 domain-containing protein [unclassified Enterobacter]ROP56314.1 uncharacterized protein DUF4123 [Enterobacter sp. BIGb0383]ROS06053.1 uncharacterized protein DUF4123 [Enterobacter sp. BIGb0359]
MSEATTWAIVDTAAEPGLSAMLDDLDPPHASLYADPVPEEIGRLAPWLVQVDDAVRHWLMQRETPWGIFLESQASLKDLRQHLRKYLHVQIPNEEKPVFFRFYDPRNIWSFLSVLSPWEQHSFLGPIDTIATHWQGNLHRENFAELKETYPSGSVSKRKMMRITQEQMDGLTVIFEQRYVDGLVEKVKAWTPPETVVDAKNIGEIFRWLKEQGITDDRSIRGLFYLFSEHHCLDLESIPSEFKSVLCTEFEDGAYKAESLLLVELGNVPL